MGKMCGIRSPSPKLINFSPNGFPWLAQKNWSTNLFRKLTTQRQPWPHPLRQSLYLQLQHLILQKGAERTHTRLREVREARNILAAPFHQKLEAVFSILEQMNQSATSIPLRSQSSTKIRAVKTCKGPPWLVFLQTPLETQTSMPTTTTIPPPLNLTNIMLLSQRQTLQHWLRWLPPRRIKPCRRICSTPSSKSSKAVIGSQIRNRGKIMTLNSALMTTK